MISILGAGAIGQLLAHKLTDASVECQFIVPDPQKYHENWLLLEDATEFKQKFSLCSVADNKLIQLLLVTVKAPQVEAALTSVKHRFNHQTSIIFFQNGMGYEKIAEGLLDAHQIYFASNTHGAFRKDQQILVYAGKGALQIGPLENSEKPPTWFEYFEEAELNASWHPDIQTVLLKKLFINAVINPLTALYQCKNGELLSSDKKQRLLALVNENSRFAQSLRLPFADNLKDVVINVIEQTTDNINSMYQDTLDNKETEINAINGYLLDMMQQHKFNAPHNWQLWSDFHISFPPKKLLAQARAKSFNSLQFLVTQQAGTERPFTGTYNQHSDTGDYSCACCDSILFDNNGKFDSHCGWPSFDKAKNNKAIAYRDDLSHGMSRTEILCAQCGSHLGHVFDDGPTDTGVRFCVNSVSLNFLKQE